LDSHVSLIALAVGNIFEIANKLTREEKIIFKLLALTCRYIKVAESFPDIFSNSCSLIVTG